MRNHQLNEDKLPDEIKKRVENIDKSKCIDFAELRDVLKSRRDNRTFLTKVWDKIRFFCMRRLNVKNWYYRIKRLIFQFRNGYDYADYWNLDYSIAKYVYPRLKGLRDNCIGGPSNILNQDLYLIKLYKEKHGSYSHEDDWFELWKFCIDLMLQAFHNVLTDDDYDDDYWNMTDDERHEFRRKRDEEVRIGMKFFSKYYRGLWD